MRKDLKVHPNTCAFCVLFLLCGCAQPAKGPAAGFQPPAQAAHNNCDDAAANEKYEQACKLYWQGQHLSSLSEEERQALQLFVQVVRESPQSDKVALAAYYIGQVYVRAGRYRLAVQWYECAWRWDRHVPEPARLMAAIVYDRHLNDPANAVRCYRLSMKYDPQRYGCRHPAQERIRKLTTQP